MTLPIHSPKTTQCGITLIEALIALLILCLGILGLAQVEARMLVETHTTNSRATAIGLMADLAERIRLNAQGAQPVSTSTPLGPSPPMSPYAFDSCLSTSTPPDFPSTPPAPPSCDPMTTGCDSNSQAQYDVSVWSTEVSNTLPNGRACIQQVAENVHQLRVVIAWTANENTNITLTDAGLGTNKQVAYQLQITDDNKNPLCPSAAPGSPYWICHVDFIDIPSLNP